MLEFLSALLPSVFIGMGVVPLMGVSWWRRRQRRSRGTQSPLSKDLFRPPGHALRDRIRDLNDEISAHAVMIIIAPLIGYSIFLSQAHFGGARSTTFGLVSLIVIMALFVGIGAKRLLGLIHERQNYELGLDGELITAHELNQLMLDGCRVFHDIPMDYGNIDHVVVSQSGVYSVNTKMVRQSTETAKTPVRVDCDQGVIEFPGFTRSIPSDQLDTERRWLANCLSSAVGETVDVEAMLALPGWYIGERSGKGAMSVINPVNAKNFFVRSRRVLSPTMIGRIAYQLEQLCRDVSPFDRDEKGWVKESG